MFYKGYKIIQLNFDYQIFDRAGRPIYPNAQTVEMAQQIIDDRINSLIAPARAAVEDSAPGRGRLRTDYL